MFDKVTGWAFLQEPLYRWFVFFGAMVVIAAMWGVILGYMKKAA